MTTVSNPLPRATIVMTARERHSLTEAAIESIVADTAPPYRFLYLDVQSPDWLREALAERAGEWGLEVIRFDEPLWPQAARRRVTDTIATDYTVFIDNDVQVEPGWLDHLVACADETGAGIVGPLYLWGDGIESPRIHMAGGRLTEEIVPEGRVLDEAHHLINADPRQVAGELVRRPCDFVEFHCMLVRTSLLRDPAFLDPDIRCVHEHIDVALTSVQRGFPVYFEPAARVQYMAFTDYMLDDLAFYRERWAAADGEASIAAFSRKWNVLDDARSFGGVRDFLRHHRAAIDPLRPLEPAPADRHTPMDAAELVPSRSALLDLAAARGYDADDVALIARAYGLAQILVDGGYRPCGRPFINHLVGTAGVLVRYDFSAQMVAAGMLHAAYTHADTRQGGAGAAADATRAALAEFGHGLERRVRAYTEQEAADSGVAGDADRIATLSIYEAESILLAAANEVEMLLSGEIRYSGRTDGMADHMVRQAVAVCGIVGAGGLAQTLVDHLLGAQQPVASALQTGHDGSYRIAPDQRSLVSMVSPAPLPRDRAGS